MSGEQTRSAATNSSAPTNSSAASSHRAILTPSSTPAVTPQAVQNSPPPSFETAVLNSTRMDSARDESKPDDVELKQSEEPTTGISATGKAESSSSASQKKAKPKKKCTKDHKHKKKSKKSKKAATPDDSSDSDSDSDDDDDASTTSDSSDSTDSEEEKRLKKMKTKKLKAKAKRKAEKKKAKKRSKSKKVVVESSSSSDDSDSPSSDSESESEATKRRRKRSKKAKKASEESSSSDEAEEEAEAADEEEDSSTDLAAQLAALQEQIQQQQSSRTSKRRKASTASDTASAQNTVIVELLQRLLKKETKQKSKKEKSKEKSKKKPKKGSKLEYKRVDELWDSSIHNFTITESAEDKVDEFDEYIFCVRRRFDWENKYRSTVVDIKSKILRDSLAEVMKEVKGVSLVEDQPSVDPNMLFLYLEELRTYYKRTLKTQLKEEKKRKHRRRIKTAISHCKVLVTYLDEDYESTKKRLYPMLEAGNITFDLLWALFKPNSIAFTSTYGSWEDPRCFKVDFANKESSLIKGEWYCIEGRYLEYDGKTFGLGDFEVNIEQFQGPRKITSLMAYPLKYHKDPNAVTKQLVARGKRFVELAGTNYRFHKGLAFHKKKKAVLRFNINGRIMIDPAIFRRVNANYPISLLNPKDQDDLFSDDEDEDECGCESDADEHGRPTGGDKDGDSGDGTKTKFRLVKDGDGEYQVIDVPVDEDGQEIRLDKFTQLQKGDDANTDRTFSEEDLLIASPVVLGFAFSEKAWLEFTISGVREIEWNTQAFESLVLPEDRKSIVKALVSAHKFHPAETIDDVVQGKGKGLVFVLHGSPGVGKTLTAEGIAEYLKCPLYSVTAGELGTDSHVLEQELQKIMDIAHSWGAVLLLDEADVFLEKRQHQDVHRNALVSIFLRLLEYFQGMIVLSRCDIETKSLTSSL